MSETDSGEPVVIFITIEFCLQSDLKKDARTVTMIFFKGGGVYELTRQLGSKSRVVDQL
jgi:hypothetical protein